MRSQGKIPLNPAMLLAVLAKAKQGIQARAKARCAQEKAEYDEKVANREKP